jgi:hypothetical protein
VAKRKEPKLSIEMIPRSTWGQNLRSLLKKEEWDEIRRECYAIAGYRCEICRGVGIAHPVECHERWEFDNEERVQRLVGTIALCPACHRVKHIGRTEGTADAADTLNHLRRVNGWKRSRMLAYVERAFRQHRKRDLYHWTVDISWARRWLDTQGGLVDPPSQGEQQ